MFVMYSGSAVSSAGLIRALFTATEMQQIFRSAGMAESPRQGAEEPGEYSLGDFGSGCAGL